MIFTLGFMALLIGMAGAIVTAAWMDLTDGAHESLPLVVTALGFVGLAVAGAIAMLGSVFMVAWRLMP